MANAEIVANRLNRDQMMDQCADYIEQRATQLGFKIRIRGGVVAPNMIVMQVEPFKTRNYKGIEALERELTHHFDHPVKVEPEGRITLAREDGSSTVNWETSKGSVGRAYLLDFPTEGGSKNLSEFLIMDRSGVRLIDIQNIRLLNGVANEDEVV